MPITPLHFGVLAPINHFAKGKVSNVSFVLANVWLDAPSIIYGLTGYGDISHTNHTLIDAALIALLLSIVRFRHRAWWLGAFIGTLSHVLLDSLVHTDVNLLSPWLEGNPLYMGWMEPLSIALLPFAVWWAIQCMSGIRDWIAKVRGAAASAPPSPSI